MRQIFERIDVDIVGAAGQEGVERCPIVFVATFSPWPRRVISAGRQSDCTLCSPH